ncbi:MULTISPECIES: septation regulator SpoVG [Peptoniphilus]|uniref:Putative septation protein SpoVG n=1 Tax=Peptoniphilus duerdenii ATCC BAA-1640 TaxID=862517 RepID=E0NNN6_9FIRM|nr:MULTISPECIES: septation regulator SpoVG [Peptoniphilus]EFM24639.1 stage V sporulation protein G [Peptoniphilus duerdenii ATCC BAA-1640]ERT64991.1 putative negative regulator of asymmetric septation [Peptoniphilus sp. BV3AC2]MDK8275711.1 septation regulator SpoVG [Peptoniphilus duerdenii]
MNITDVRIRKIHGVGNLRAVASVTFDDAFVVHDIKVIQGDSSLFIAMPSRKLSNGEFRDIAHPINQEARSAIEKIIFERYEELPEEDEAETSEGTEE